MISKMKLLISLVILLTLGAVVFYFKNYLTPNPAQNFEKQLQTSGMNFEKAVNENESWSLIQFGSCGSITRKDGKLDYYLQYMNTNSELIRSNDHMASVEYYLKTISLIIKTGLIQNPDCSMAEVVFETPSQITSVSAKLDEKLIASNVKVNVFTKAK